MRRLTTLKNLQLAWRRISSGQNASYKNHFRQLYEAYGLNLDANLRSLSRALKDATYTPSAACRLMTPKNGGLQRPISLLTIEDQIVYQSIVNLVADDVCERRQLVERKLVYSNIWTQSTNENFMVAPWKDGYKNLRFRIANLALNGYTEAATFDLASYYDTISHGLLLEALQGATMSTGVNALLHRCLACWSHEACSHGIPQGPIASDILAECFLLPCDEQLTNFSDRVKFVRYVDDVYVIAKNRVNVQRGIARLDEIMRTRGLIPHVDKHACTSTDRVLKVGVLPSLVGLNLSAPANILKVRGRFRSTLDRHGRLVKDESSLRFILHRASIDQNIKKFAMRLMPTHPYLAPAFGDYLARCGRSKATTTFLIGLLESDPVYDEVEAVAWSVLVQTFTMKSIVKIRAMAATRLTNLPAQRRASRLALLEFLAKMGDSASIDLALDHFLSMHEPALLPLALQRIGIGIKDSTLGPDALKKALTHDEPGLACTGARMVAFENIPLGWIGCNNDLSQPSRSLLEGLGSIPRSTRRQISSIATHLYNLLGCKRWGGWQLILHEHHGKALGQLVLSVHNQDNPSHWMNLTDSFNDIVVRSLFEWLVVSGTDSTAPKTVNSKSELIDYGSLLESGNFLKTEIPTAYQVLTRLHSRRNALPSSHPRNRKTGAYNRVLSKREQSRHMKSLTDAFDAITAYMRDHGVN